MSLFTFRRLASLLPMAVAALMAGCSTPPPAPPPPVAQQPLTVVPPFEVSEAPTAASYRYDAASHLYELNGYRIYHGVMPNFLYAIGVLQVQVDAQGRVANLSWLRAPEHAPEVVAEIERMVRRAAPFPAPVRLGGTTYIDTWLWDISGRFQLRTLTEGQAGLATVASRQANPDVPPEAMPHVVRVVSAP